MKKIMQTARWGVGMILIFFGGYLQGQDLKELASAGWDTTIIDPDTRRFTFNDSTGEVSGCDFIRLSASISWEDVENRRKVFNSNCDRIFQKIGKEIRSQMDENIKGGLLSPDGKFLVCFREYDDGVHSLWFFDSTGMYLNRYFFEKPEICYFDFNDSGTYFMISSQFNGNFYFFRSTGDLVRKGNIHELIPESTTSYGRSNISADGKVWLLNNTKTYIMGKNGNLIAKTGGHNYSILNADGNYIAFLLSNYLIIYDIIEKKITYSYRTKNRLSKINNKIIMFNQKKTGYYEYEMF